MDPTPAPPPSTAAAFVERHQGLLIVLLAAFALRISGIAEWWLNPDEGIYYSILTRATFEGFWEEVSSNAHPPLYYLLLRGMGALTWDFFWFRVFTVICGVAAVWTMWAVALSLAGRGVRGSVAGLIAALFMAFAPGAIELSQVMRPYMLQVALLAGSLFFLLRYLEGTRDGRGELYATANRDLSTYTVLVLLALLTHYSSVLALAAFGLVVLQDGMANGTRRSAWRKAFTVHALPGMVLILVYFVHLRPLMASELADDALDGWLRPYMISSPRDAWLAFLGFQHLLADPWARTLTAVLSIATLVVSSLGVRGRERAEGDPSTDAGAGAPTTPDAHRPAVLIAAGFLVAIGVASFGAYPFGSTRHSAWLLVFVVPCLGWIGAYALSRSGRPVRLWGTALVLLVAFGAPIGRTLGATAAPWAPSDQVLRQSNIVQMSDILDPEGAPELIVMSAQTFYLLIPLYPIERERAVRSGDGSIFHFPLGERTVLVSEAWDFTGGSDPNAPSHIAGVLSTAGRQFPELRLSETRQALLLIGGWRPPVIDELAAASARGPFLVSQRSVPGLYGFLLDLPELWDAFGVAGPAAHR